jgi:hypothetical protein
MNGFKESTQYKNWLFKSKQELDKAQISKFERGLKILAELNRDLHGAEYSHMKDNKEIKNVSQAQSQSHPTKVSVNLKSNIKLNT